jgi:hypothetical protein
MGNQIICDVYPFFSEKNKTRLHRAAKDMDAGKWTAHELVEVDSDESMA